MAKRRKTTKKSTKESQAAPERDLFAAAEDGEQDASDGAAVSDGAGGNNGASGGGSGGSSRGGAGGPGDDSVVALHEAAQSRYLNYALSVITSRALPDVRDGLKPVQRRILYTMWQLGLRADAKHRKSANVVGEVMGKLHPHGDSAIYDAMVRMAQPFALRYPLVDGSGNFGSLDGDPPAAYRYTECRLARIADELLSEIGQQTVPFRANYDGTRDEPVVLPSRIPNLLINGSSGIAVGMATNIPPHNLEEVTKALIRMLDAQLKDQEISNRELCRTVKGPDFPTGGEIVTPPEEIKQMYESGHGSIKIRGTWEKPKVKPGKAKRNSEIYYITSVPYGINKSVLVEQIAAVVIGRRLPILQDVRDLSADDVRIELEVKKDADIQKVMAYLYKHTPLQTNFAVNMTSLVPTENPEVGQPQRLDLKSMLWHFLHFRLEVVTRRLEHELAQLKRRIHILEGFKLVFDALDEIIKIIRASEGKADAAQKIMKRFPLDAEQTDAILELKLYRLAKLEILVILDELNAKKTRAAEIEKLLEEQEATGRWGLVREELEEVLKAYGDKRRTLISDVEDEPEYSEEDFIIAEDAVVVVTRDGWIKRQKEVKDLSTQRIREGDSILTAEAGSTRSTIAFFTNHGVCYSMRIIDVPATTGYGEPIQKFFKLKDGEKVIAAYSMDLRVIGEIKPKKEGLEPPVHGVAATSDGYALRFSLEPYIEASTKAGRKFARPAVKKGVEVVGMQSTYAVETVIAASRAGRGILCPVDEINFLAGPGKGVQLIKLGKDDQLLGFKLSEGDRDLMRVETTRGSEQTISTAKYETTSRGGKGRELMKRGGFVRILPDEPEIPVMPE